MLEVFVKGSRCQVICTRCCLCADAFLVGPDEAAALRDCEIRRYLSVALSNTFWLTWARIGPGKSQLMPLINTAGITFPAITAYSEVGW